MQKGKAASAFGGVGRGPTGVIKSVLDASRADGKGRDEIFVDIVEKISCTFSASGYVQTSQIDGAIQAPPHGPENAQYNNIIAQYNSTSAKPSCHLDICANCPYQRSI